MSFMIVAAAVPGLENTISASPISSVDKEIRELEKEQQELREKESRLNSDKSETESKLEENKQKQQSVEEQIKAINEKLENTENEIKANENEIAKTNKELNELEEEIDQLNNEINELKERIKKRDELLKNRLRSIQKTGGNVQYMAVILGSENFSDFISRSSAVNTIMDQDKSIMEEHARDKRNLEKKQTEMENKKAEVEEKKASLEEKKKELTTLQMQFDQQKKEQQNLMKKLEEEYGILEDHKLSVEEEQKLIAAQAASLEKAKQLAEQQKEKLKKEAEQANSNSGSGGNKVSSGGSGNFIWPASGRFSSGFGPRTHPIYGNNRPHNGIDIAAGVGTPIVASASGVVAYAGWMNGYGNTVMITHSINGQTFTTLYAHMSSISVSNGQSVSQGQQIGGIGSTGNSTGPHLHFEIHPGGYKNPANPMSYLN